MTSIIIKPFLFSKTENEIVLQIYKTIDKDFLFFLYKKKERRIFEVKNGRRVNAFVRVR